MAEFKPLGAPWRTLPQKEFEIAVNLEFEFYGLLNRWSADRFADRRASEYEDQFRQLWEKVVGFKRYLKNAELLTDAISDRVVAVYKCIADVYRKIERHLKLPKLALKLSLDDDLASVRAMPTKARYKGTERRKRPRQSATGLEAEKAERPVPAAPSGPQSNAKPSRKPGPSQFYVTDEGRRLSFWISVLSGVVTIVISVFQLLRALVS